MSSLMRRIQAHGFIFSVFLVSFLFAVSALIQTALEPCRRVLCLIYFRYHQLRI